MKDKTEYEKVETLGNEDFNVDTEFDFTIEDYLLEDFGYIDDKSRSVEEERELMRDTFEFVYRVKERLESSTEDNMEELKYG